MSRSSVSPIRTTLFFPPGPVVAHPEKTRPKQSTTASRFRVQFTVPPFRLFHASGAEKRLCFRSGAGRSDTLAREFTLRHAWIGKAPYSPNEGGTTNARAEESLEEIRFEEEGSGPQTCFKESREETRTAGAAEGSGQPAERDRTSQPAHGLHDPPPRRREAVLHGPPRIPQIRAGSQHELSLRSDWPFLERRIHASDAGNGGAQPRQGADALLHGPRRGPRLHRPLREGRPVRGAARGHALGSSRHQHDRSRGAPRDARDDQAAEKLSPAR